MYNVIFMSGYNNYWNRIVKDVAKRHQSYYINLDECAFSEESVNFDPGDGVYTSLIVNYPAEVSDQTGLDYVVVSDELTGKVDSKWFVIERIRRLGGQFLLRLKRDSVSDHYDVVRDADIFVEKATISDPSDPLIFNSESMDFNEIKSREDPLQDELRIPWIVGYLAPYNSDHDAVGDLSADVSLVNMADYEFEEASDFYYNDSQRDYIGRPKIKIRMYVGSGTDAGYYDITTSGVISNFISYPGTIDYGYDWRGGSKIAPDVTVKTMWGDHNDPDYMGYFLTGNYPEYLPTGVVAFGSKPPYVYDNKYVKIINDDHVYLVNTVSTNKTVYCKVPRNSDLFNRMVEIIANCRSSSWLPVGDPNGSTFALIIDCEAYRVNKKVVDSFTGSAFIGANRFKCNDAPYDIFCIPAADVDVYKGGSLKAYTQRGEVSLAAAMGLATKYSGAGVIYDLQLLPYCPVREYIDQRGYEYVLDVGNAGTVYGTISDDEDNEIGVILYARRSSFTLDVIYEIDVSTDPTELKVQNMTDVWRLVSPNYSGAFQFSAAKNNGVTHFNVDCQYKPYAPYIHVNPNFGGLYGQDYNDTRGLIVGGEFSLPIVTDAWSTYEIQNKNYATAFDRQIQNMEVNNAVQREREIWQMVSGVVGATASGAETGAKLGGGAGGAVGAAVGAAISTYGAIRDLQLSDQLRAEGIDYTKDMYGYSLGNIKALPYSLSRVSAYNPNNKIFPILELYTCSEREKNALRDKIKYNGMTIMAIGKLSQYQRSEPTYFKGQIIRMLGADELEAHEYRDLYDELNRGVYI